MTNFELMQKIIHEKNKLDVIRLLKQHRIPANKSKYC